MSIRLKVILPFLILTLLAAAAGVYVVTRLVSNSLNERLTVQLLEAGRVASDGVARQEIEHIELARLVSYTNGVADAVNQGNGQWAKTLILPVAISLEAENLILIDPQGRELLHLLQQPDGTLQEVGSPSGAGSLSIVQRLLDSADPEILPQQAIGKNPIDDLYYYYTALPVGLNNRTVGAVVIGTSLNTILPYLKSVSLADVVIYNTDGQVISTTIPAGITDPEVMKSLAFPVQDYDQILSSDKIVRGQNFKLGKQWYSLARGSLRVGKDHLGVFAVVLPMNTVIQPGSASRNTYIFIFAAALIGVVLIGYGVSRWIFLPLSSLVHTSQEIAKGDLSQRSGIRTKDEIGALASSLDDMTANLQKRNADLERTHQHIEQMDRTKDRFIDAVANELRSPLIAAKTYAQMMETKAQDSTEGPPMPGDLAEETGRMIEIINNILDVSRIDTKSLALSPEMVTINSVISWVQLTFQRALQERQLMLITDGLNDLPAIRADPKLIYKVFYHLILNAIKYTPDGGTITVRGRKVQEAQASPQLEIVVEDTGIGIAPENQELIFEKYFQTGEVMPHPKGKTWFKSGGPGLGLAIARGIVQAHGGRIWVDSLGIDEAVCPGSRFYLHLPLDGIKA